ncbi:hypothetical protein [Spiroplasma endosymbiont of Ammophila pubescens]|uniref:hypothetical protein n=1 Tax=Spiroplasma endosymbiont of Ammophila pubescens TaxID=3066315 RepID=UPI0032B18468
MLDEQRSYIQNTLLERKTILSTDLIKTINYHQLNEQLDITNNVYGVLFNGKYYYFYTLNDALTYFYNNIDITFHSDVVANYYVYFDEQKFSNKSDFYKWINDNTQLVKGNGEVYQNET